MKVDGIEMYFNFLIAAYLLFCLVGFVLFTNTCSLDFFLTKVEI